MYSGHCQYCPDKFASEVPRASCRASTLKTYDVGRVSNPEGDEVPRAPSAPGGVHCRTMVSGSDDRASIGEHTRP